MRIGLFGGTFNPIHYGHLRAATEVAEQFDLTRILFVPLSLPPHKEMKEIAPPEDRLEMTRLATKNTSAFSVSDVELKRSGVSYTIDTVTYFKKMFACRDQLFLIMGMDAFWEVDTWKSYRELFQQLPVIIMERPNIDGKNAKRKNDLLDFIKDKISDAYQLNSEKHCYYHPAMQTIYHVDVSLLDISGTKIRAYVRQGKSIRFLVSEQVEKYIYERGLYL